MNSGADVLIGTFYRSNSFIVVPYSHNIAFYHLILDIMLNYGSGHGNDYSKSLTDEEFLTDSLPSCET